MKHWQRLVGLFFLLVIVDGALRKWVLPSQETVLLLLKDIVLWGGYVIYAWRRAPFGLPRPLRSTWVPALLAAYILVVLLQAFNIRQPNFLVGAIGLKSHLAYIPLVVLLPALLARTTRQQVIRCLRRYTLFIFVPLVALGVYQYFQPPTAWINKYVGESEYIAAAGGAARITGSFSYIGEFVQYIKFSAYLGASVLLAGLRWEKKEIKILGSILLGGTAIVLPMAGSRSVVLLGAGGIVAIVLISRLGGRHLVRILAGGALALVLVVQAGGGALQGWSTLAERAGQVGTDEAGGRIERTLLTPVNGIEAAGLLGYGVGTNHKAAAPFIRSNWEGRYPGDYSSLRVVLELGILGWLVLVALKIALLYLAFQAVRRSGSPPELIISATAFAMLLSHLILPIVYSLVASALYWGSAGAMLGLWSLQTLREGRRRKLETANV